MLCDQHNFKMNRVRRSLGLHRVTLASAAPEHAASIAPMKSNMCANVQEEHPITAPKQKVLKFLSLVGVSDLRLISDSIGVRMDK
jgi:hypothetical protein